MEYAFGHHVWATVRVIDACLELTPEQLETSVPGTYGPIIRTLRHLVGSDSWYLLDLTGNPARRIDEKSMISISSGMRWRPMVGRGRRSSAKVATPRRS